MSARRNNAPASAVADWEKWEDKSPPKGFTASMASAVARRTAVGVEARRLDDNMAEREFRGRDFELVGELAGGNRGGHGRAAGVAGAHEKHCQIGHSVNNAFVDDAGADDGIMVAVEADRGWRSGGSAWGRRRWRRGWRCRRDRGRGTGRRALNDGGLGDVAGTDNCNGRRDLREQVLSDGKFGAADGKGSFRGAFRRRRGRGRRGRRLRQRGLI